MRFPRPGYRLRQFFAALFAKPAPEDLREVEKWLSPQEFALFARLQPGEQAHSLSIFKSIQSGGGTLDQEQVLLVAALLHDVGKCCYPLHLWERVWIVLAQALLPGLVEHWGGSGGRANPKKRAMERIPWWQRPFIVAVQHPQWGAELAAEAGASPLVVALIRRHQDPLPADRATFEDRLLYALQRVDGVF